MTSISSFFKSSLLIAMVVALSSCNAACISQSSQDKKDQKKGGGKLNIEYIPSEDPKLAPYEKLLEDSVFFNRLLEVSNKILDLPRSVDVKVADCGTVNAMYSAKHKALIICNELIASTARSFPRKTYSKEDVDRMTVHTLSFVFFHEFGHALVDQFNLPVLGREEDAVDDFATLFLLSLGEDGKVAISDATSSFLYTEEGDLGDSFADSHSINIQRFYGIGCLAYGSDPVYFKEITDDMKALKERRCDVEYKKKLSSWEKLIQPYMKSRES
jgi:hypothetical protein